MEELNKTKIYHLENRNNFGGKNWNKISRLAVSTAKYTEPHNRVLYLFGSVTLMFLEPVQNKRRRLSVWICYSVMWILTILYQFLRKINYSRIQWYNCSYLGNNMQRYGTFLLPAPREISNHFWQYQIKTFKLAMKTTRT